MSVKSLNKSIILWLFVLLPILATLVFRKSFNLGLYGDDWQHLYNLWRDFFVYKTKSFFDIKSYLNPYWPEYLYLGIINHFWGYYPPAYFIASFLMRLFANIALYFFSFELTKSRLAAFLTTVIFLVCAAGLQTTDWVFNMNTFAGLGLLAIAATIYLKIRPLKTFRSLYWFAFIVLFTLALAIVPTRMHGAAPFIVLMEFCLLFSSGIKKIKLDKYLIVRLFLPILIFYMLIHLRSFGEESYAGGRFNDSYKLVQALIQKGFYSFWLYFLAIISHQLLPDNIAFPFKNNLTWALVFEGLLSIFFMGIGTFSITGSKKIIQYLPIVIFNFIWLGFLKVFSKIDVQTSNDIYLAISLGGQILFWMIYFYAIGRKKYPEISITLIISIIWAVSLTILHWLFTPYYVIETTGRYMTMGSAGMAIFLATIVGLLIKSSLETASQKKSDSKLLGSIYLGVPLIILLSFLLVNFKTGQDYLDILNQTRNKDLTEKTWNTLVREVPNLDQEGPSVFYFTTDNPLSLQGVLVFGFFMRAGMTYRIPVQDLTPLPSTDYNELLNFVKDGSPLQKVHGRKAIPVPLSRIFAFDFRNGELINITDMVRKNIQKDLILTQ